MKIQTINKYGYWQETPINDNISSLTLTNLDEYKKIIVDLEKDNPTVNYSKSRKGILSGAKIHKLKIKPEYYTEVEKGNKKAELRKNDRDYQIGDGIVFVVIDDKGNETKTDGLYIITHVLKDVSQYGLQDGYAILSIEYIGALGK